MSNVNTPDVLAHSMAESLMRDNQALRAEVASLKEELARQKACNQDMVVTVHSLTQQLAAANGMVERMRDAIQQTLDENGHLADGDTCTLILLKRALSDLHEYDGSKD